MKRMAVFPAAIGISLAAFALGAQARPFHKDKDRSGQAEEQKAPSRVWTPGTEVRAVRGHQVVLLPAWQSEQAALGREDASGHIP